jgi:DNA (cytosine-5)-methyltransferase 1
MYAQDIVSNSRIGHNMSLISPLHGVSGLTSVEVCAGAGGQALGLERSGFKHLALVEVDQDCCATLKLNRPDWAVFAQDLRGFDSSVYRGVDLFAGGLPCPPFSVAGKQLGEADERNLFSAALQHVNNLNPAAVLFENVRGLLNPQFDAFRRRFQERFEQLGFRSEWRLVHAAHYGVPQLRPRLLFVALKRELWPYFAWPEPIFQRPPTVGEVLGDLIREAGWIGADSWVRQANDIAPTIVGGSKKHGGPDLGPTRAREAWRKLGVDGRGIADKPPSREFEGSPRLTVRMVARLQGFTDDWHISGRKTAAYRQVGNAFPPPVAQVVGFQIATALLAARRDGVVNADARSIAL